MNVNRSLTGRSDEPCTWCKKTNKKGVKHITYSTGCIVGSHKLCKKCEDIIEDNGLALPETSKPTAAPVTNNTAPQLATK